MNLGKFTFYKLLKTTTLTVGYSSPKKPTFFEFLILHTIINYPNKELSLYDILDEKLKIFNLDIFTTTLETLMVKNNFINLDNIIGNSGEYSSNDYELEYIYFPLKHFSVNQEVKKSLANHLIPSSTNIMEKEIKIVIDDYQRTVDITIPKKQLYLEDKEPQDNIIPVNSREITNQLIYKELILYKDSREQNIFTDKTTFDFIKKGYDKIHFDEVIDISSYFTNAYEEIKVEFKLDNTSEISLFTNDLIITKYLNNNIKAKNELIKTYLEYLRNKNEIFNVKDSPQDNSLYKSESRSIYDNFILKDDSYFIVNSMYIDKEAFRENSLDVNHNASVGYFINSHEPTSYEIINEKIIFNININDLQLPSDFYMLLKSRSELHVYTIKKLNLKNYKTETIVLKEYIDEVGQTLYKDIESRIHEAIKKLINIDFVQDIDSYLGLLLGCIYMIKLTPNSNSTYEKIINWLFIDKVKNNDLINELISSIKELPEFSEFFKILKDKIKNMYQYSQNSNLSITKYYQQLNKYDVFTNKEILNYLLHAEKIKDFKLEDLLNLTLECDEFIIEKIWKQNRFKIVAKFVKCIANDRFYNYYDERLWDRINNDLDDIEILWNLYNMAMIYDESISKLNNRRDASFLTSEKWKSIWTDFENIITMLSNQANSNEDIILNLYAVLSNLERGYLNVLGVKLKEFNKTLLNQEYLEAAYFLYSKIKRYLEDQFDDIKHLNDINERLYYVSKHKLNNKSAKSLSNILINVKNYLFCHQYRNSQNNEEIKDELKKLNTKMDEVIKNEHERRNGSI